MIDLELLNSVSKGDEEFRTTMFNIFLKQTPECLSDLNAGINEKDFSRIRGAAHKMKSSMGLMGMKETEIMCQKVEEASKNENLQEAIDLSSQIKSDCELAFKEVQAQLK